LGLDGTLGEVISQWLPGGGLLDIAMEPGKFSSFCNQRVTMAYNSMMATGVDKFSASIFGCGGKNQGGLTFQIFNGSNAVLDSVLD
jgi:hypothetical protein